MAHSGILEMAYGALEMDQVLSKCSLGYAPHAQHPYQEIPFMLNACGYIGPLMPRNTKAYPRT